MRVTVGLGEVALWLLAYALTGIRGIARRLRPGLPKPVRYLIALMPYEPRPAIGLGVYAFVVFITVGYGVVVGIGTGTGFGVILANFIIFSIIGFGWGGVFTVPMVWSRLWILRVDITPDGHNDSWVSPMQRGAYGPEFWDSTRRTLTVVNTALWGDAQLQWARAQGRPSGERPMDHARRNRKITTVAVAQVYNQQQLQADSTIEKAGTWEKPVHVAASVGLILGALFLALALMSSPKGV